VERRVQGALLDLELVVGGLFDPADHAEAVHRSPGECFHDEEIERTANEVEVGFHAGVGRGS
jgi:hypothetical protein